MPQLLVKLVLIPLLLLPPGVCPCHFFEEYLTEDACISSGEHLVPLNTEPDVPIDVNLANTLGKNHHHEKPCEDCLARKLVAGQYTTHAVQNFVPDMGLIFLFLESVPLSGSVLISESNFSAPGPVFWPATLPVYLTLRTLLL